jgi:hypothetical protein
MSRDISKKDLVKSAQEASEKAVNKTRKAGGAVTFQSGKKIIKKHASGRVEVLKELEKAYVRTTKKRYCIA